MLLNATSAFSNEWLFSTPSPPQWRSDIALGDNVGGDGGRDDDKCDKSSDDGTEEKRQPKSGGKDEGCGPTNAVPIVCTAVSSCSIGRA